jgi:hypothetical protein
MDISEPLAAGSAAGALLSSIACAEHKPEPYHHWLLSSTLPERICQGIVGLPFSPPADGVMDGRRESNNSARVYFSSAIQEKHPVCRELADAFKHPLVRDAIRARTGRDVSIGKVRIEYCQDVDGFWLEPHVDIPVKLFTMLVYLSREPELRDAGTDIYDATPEHNRVGTAPCMWNAGLIFIPGHDTWHGFTPRTIRGVRKSIIVNYVTNDWRAVEELA